MNKSDKAYEVALGLASAYKSSPYISDQEKESLINGVFERYLEVLKEIKQNE